VDKNNFCTLLVGMKISVMLLKALLTSLKELKTELVYDPAFPILGIYLNECVPGYNKATCTPMFLQHYSQLPSI
jgi:hypothetical protein